MANRTGNWFPRQMSPNMKSKTYVPAVQTIYFNTLIGMDNTSGLVKKWSDTSGASLDFLGLSQEGPLVGDASTRNLPVDIGGTILLGMPVAGSTRAGVAVYCATDNPNDFTITPTTNAKRIGIIDAFRSATDCDVRLLTPGEYLGIKLP